jgi:hypothetical protein
MIREHLSGSGRILALLLTAFALALMACLASAIAAVPSHLEGMCGARSVWSTFSEPTTTIFGCLSITERVAGCGWIFNSSSQALHIPSVS